MTESRTELLVSSLLISVKYSDTSEHRKPFQFFLPVSYSYSVRAEHAYPEHTSRLLRQAAMWMSSRRSTGGWGVHIFVEIFFCGSMLGSNPLVLPDSVAFTTKLLGQLPFLYQCNFPGHRRILLIHLR